jgi:spore photoproduct lyase
MPQRLSDILEPKSTKISDRIKAINTFIEAGYDVHVNYSPVILYAGWVIDYYKLFKEINIVVKDEYKNRVKSEVIFLTHNKEKHYKNMLINPKGEELLWQPHLQEEKVSQYGGNNIRYKAGLKAEYIEQFKTLHSDVIDWNTIRYIF